MSRAIRTCYACGAVNNEYRVSCIKCHARLTPTVFYDIPSPEAESLRREASELLELYDAERKRREAIEGLLE